MENNMDELNIEPLEPLDGQEPEKVPEKAPEKEPEKVPEKAPVVASGIQPWNFKRLILPAGIVIAILLAVGIYLLVAPEPEKLIAEVLRFDVLLKPDTATVVISISNKQEKQASITKLYPLFFGKENSGISTRSIEGSTIEGAVLPLVLYPGEVRALKIKFSIVKKDLDLYADKLKDSSHTIVSQNGPPSGQLEGTLGLGWSVKDADGKDYTSLARIASFILTPTPAGSADRTVLTHYRIISDDLFELCTNEDIVK